MFGHSVEKFRVSYMRHRHSNPQGPGVNILRPSRNEQHFADDIFKRIFFNENDWISIKSSMKFVLIGPINNIPALVRIMAWCRSGDKPLSEPMVVSLPTHICVIRPQWVKTLVASWRNHIEKLITLWIQISTFGPNSHIHLNSSQ